MKAPTIGNQQIYSTMKESCHWTFQLLEYLKDQQTKYRSKEDNQAITFFKIKTNLDNVKLHLVKARTEH